MKKTIVLAAVMILAACTSNNGGYDAEGFFESDEITVSAETNGRILQFDVREGDVVEPGQVLGLIDSTQLYLSLCQLNETSRSLDSSSPDVSVQLSVLKKQLAKSKTERERVGRLVADGAAPKKNLEDIDSQIEILKAQIKAQESALTKSTSSIDAQGSSLEYQKLQILDQLSKCYISSPAGGTILSKYMNAGEFASAGRPLFKVADLEHLRLKVYVQSSQLSKIQLGQQVKVFADFGGDNVKEYSGTISWISSKSEFTPKFVQTSDERENLVYAVKVDVLNDGFIKLGMYGGIRY